MMIDERAVVHEGAQLGEGVEVGPFSIIGPDVVIGDRCKIAPHVVINGHTTIGADCEIYQFTSIGEVPQHKVYKGEPTRVEIGDRNVIREYVSIHRGTTIDESVTSIGNDNMIMAYCHLAHDVRVGSNVLMANGASMAGHVHVGDHAILSGFVLIHQFCHIGDHSYVGYGSGVSKDIPPFVMANGYPAHPHGINSEGMRRRGFNPEDIKVIKKAYRILYRNGLLLGDAREQLAALDEESPALKLFNAFLADSKRSIIR